MKRFFGSYVGLAFLLSLALICVVVLSWVGDELKAKEIEEYQARPYVELSNGLKARAGLRFDGKKVLLLEYAPVTDNSVTCEAFITKADGSREYFPQIDRFDCPR